MRKERKTAEIKEKIKNIENNGNHLQARLEEDSLWETDVDGYCSNRK